MASSAYLTLVGQKQGAMNGSVTQAGRENSILIHSFDVQIVSPRDPVSGLATGRRQHSPIVIVKEVDKSSPLLWSALVNNENLTTWILKFFAAGPTGVEQQTYTITLTNANVASMHESMSDTTIAANASLPLREEVSFSYQKIQWSWANPSVIAQDDWTAAV